MKKFQRTKENFVCENCGFEVIGDGYTNHCPSCLWSKHVDINPGDRASHCGGMMAPISYEKDADDIILVHKCSVCGHKKRNKIAKNDNYDNLLNLVKRLNEEK